MNIITKASLRLVRSILVEKVDIWCLVHNLIISNVAITLQMIKEVSCNTEVTML